MELIDKVRQANLSDVPDDELSLHSAKGSADKCTRIQKISVPYAIINAFMKPLDIQ